MKELKITFKILEIELIPKLKRPNKRTMIFNWLGFNFYLLLSK